MTKAEFEAELLLKGWEESPDKTNWVHPQHYGRVLMFADSAEEYSGSDYLIRRVQFIG